MALEQSSERWEGKQAPWVAQDSDGRCKIFLAPEEWSRSLACALAEDLYPDFGVVTVFQL